NRAQKNRHRCNSILIRPLRRPQRRHKKTRMSANIPGSARLWRAGLKAWPLLRIRYSGVPPKRSSIQCDFWMNKGGKKKFAIAKRNRQHAVSVRYPAIILAVILFATTAHAAEVIPPKPAGYFNDYAGVVSKEAASRFNEQLAQFERDTSDQVVVAVFPKMQSDSDIADYTQRVAQAWGVGQKDRRNGVVLFVFIQDRKMFIQVGYGLEGALPDATAFDITERHIKPLFRAGNYEAGLATGIDLIFKAI